MICFNICYISVNKFNFIFLMNSYKEDDYGIYRNLSFHNFYFYR